MAKEMEQWEKNNIFRSYLADDIFKYDVLEKIANDYKEDMKHRDKEVTRKNMEDIFKKEIDQDRTEIDILRCHAELQELLEEQPETRCDLCEDDGK